MGLKLSDGIEKIKGIGEKKRAAYKKLGITTVRQLVFHLPRKYIDLTEITAVSDCETGRFCLVKGQVLRKHGEVRIRKGLSLFHVDVSDGDVMRLTFFNTKYAVSTLKEGESYLFYGEVGGTLLKREMKSPQLIAEDRAGGFMPIYPVCVGISSKVVAQDIQRALNSLQEPITDTLPQKTAENQHLLTLDAAIRAIHRPKTEREYQNARRRIVFEELLNFSAIMIKMRSVREKKRVLPFERNDLTEFFAALPFFPTKGQRAAIEDIQNDFCSGSVMNRLIQGDVGSGKTLVAAAAVYMAKKNGRQTAFMAPTELLAQQHKKTLDALLLPLGIKTVLITGSQRAKERREAAEALKNGEYDVAVGTHALISDSTEFCDLGLVITDEQHRFGVAQRANLAAKGRDAHTLVMSATPIPRTLSLIIYGDLDVSLIKELPPGRTPVKTYRINSQKRKRALGFIKDRLDEGRQAYIVCPLVSKSEEESAGSGELLAAAEYFKELQGGEFRDYSVGLLHGKMTPAQKDKAMAEFLTNQTQLLVCTTVVEVGVDVPNAVVMMIENAERFGLSQLHQLRGRVGRGKHESSCILLTDNAGQTTSERLKALADTNDGFKIAEEDLRLRGPGDILGARQHGIPCLQNADLAADSELLQAAQLAARDILREDPDLTMGEHRFIKAALESFSRDVGDVPN